MIQTKYFRFYEQEESYSKKMTTFIPNVHIKDGEYTKTIYLMVEYNYILQIVIFYQLMFKYN